MGGAGGATGGAAAAGGSDVVVVDGDSAVVIGGDDSIVGGCRLCGAAVVVSAKQVLSCQHRCGGRMVGGPEIPQLRSSV